MSSYCTYAAIDDCTLVLPTLRLFPKKRLSLPLPLQILKRNFPKEVHNQLASSSFDIVSNQHVARSFITACHGPPGHYFRESSVLYIIYMVEYEGSDWLQHVPDAIEMVEIGCSYGYLWERSISKKHALCHMEFIADRSHDHGGCSLKCIKIISMLLRQASILKEKSSNILLDPLSISII